MPSSDKGNYQLLHHTILIRWSFVDFMFCFFFFFLARFFYHASAGQQNWGHWCHLNGCLIRIWSCKFALQLYLSLHQVSLYFLQLLFTLSFFFPFLVYIQPPIELFPIAAPFNKLTYKAYIISIACVHILPTCISFYYMTRTNNVYEERIQTRK